ncbi:MAG: pilus assembly protein [Gemmataceae bacterium]|nr:pilus assembly protein [Gemmataceae bacterium]
MRLNRRSARSGVAAVELGVLAPVLLILLVGAWEVGRMVEVQQLLTNAAREGGRQAATGVKTVSDVKDVVVRYLHHNGIKAAAPEHVTLTNITDSSRSPEVANQLDQFRITVSIPFNSVRWAALDQITSLTTLTGAAEWFSMRDIPIVVDYKPPLE